MSISPGRGGILPSALLPPYLTGRGLVLIPLGLALALAFVFLVSCFGGGGPPPQPPEPPEPPWECELNMPGCHETDPPMTCGECWHNPTGEPEHCEKAPDCAPDPPGPPDPPEPPSCTPKPQARVYWYSPNKIADGTPARCGCQNCDEWKAQDGTACYQNRYCCPVGCEDDPERGAREAELMGGEKPVWELEVYSGDLYLVASDWFGVVRGHGKGRLRWHFVNGKATSKWLEVSR